MSLLLLVRIADGLVGLAWFLAVVLQVVTVVPSGLRGMHATMLSLAWAGATLWFVVYRRAPDALLDFLARLGGTLVLSLLVLLFEGSVFVLLQSLHTLFQKVMLLDPCHSLGG